MVDAGSGRITDVRHEANLAGDVASSGSPASAPDIVRLPGRAIVPGFVNAHSHAFQRLIRARTQWRPAGESGADFWSWREAMYGAALALSPDDVYESARFCFIEMLRAGFTSVGEFHYLQRDARGEAYDERTLLARRVIDAARDVGIRICLLNVAYARGGIGVELSDAQRRFATPDLDAYLADTAALAGSVRNEPLATVGIAPHSIRAVPREWLRPLHAWAVHNDTPFHIHVAEQPAEVEASIAAYGVRPVEVLGEETIIDARLSAVHATHLTPREVALLGEVHATVVACPGTERDLGDGILPAAALLDAGAAIALGSDSQTIIDPFEEMRLVEYHERLRTMKRVVIGHAAGNRFRTAPALLDMGTRAGAGALRIDAGRIEAGALADLVAIDTGHRALAGCPIEYLPDALALCGARDIVTDVWVHGVRRIEAASHDHEHASSAAFRNLMESL